MSAASALQKLSSEHDCDGEVSDSYQQFKTDVIEGLSTSPKRLSPKYFYDDQGSHYFDEICHLEEYYPYRTELKMLPDVMLDASQTLNAKKPGSQYAVVEFGAGALDKVKPLLDTLKNIQQFVPLDIAGDFLRANAEQLQEEFPNIAITPVEADFTQPVSLPCVGNLELLGFFPGSTIGNFHPDEAAKFLINARHTLKSQSYLLVGVDTKKSVVALHNAYNDRAGSTQAFNMNLLTRMNRELDADFDCDKFEHYAFYNPTKSRIEMHLVSAVEQTVNIGSARIHFAAGESIHTESSYKYAPQEFSQLASSAGWQVEAQWLAEDDMFSMFLLKAD